MKRVADVAKVGIILSHAPTKVVKWHHTIILRVFSTKRRICIAFYKLHSYQDISYPLWSNPPASASERLDSHAPPLITALYASVATLCTHNIR